MGLIIQGIKDKFSSVPKEERLKFQGISLGENIDTFEAQLQLRGWVKSSDVPKSMSLIAKGYDGTFNGKKAILVICYNIVLRNIQFVTIAYAKINRDEVLKQNQENIRRIIEIYGVTPQKRSFMDTVFEETVFEMKHGRIECSIESAENGYYNAVVVYTNNPNNVRFVESRYNEF